MPGAPGGLAVHGDRVRSRGIGTGQVGQAAGAGQGDDPPDRGGARCDVHAKYAYQCRRIQKSLPPGIRRYINATAPAGRRIRAARKVKDLCTEGQVSGQDLP
ncbi:hypothetical protein KNE206_61690 [Kitasatospora sp. NE20-6]